MNNDKKAVRIFAMSLMADLYEIQRRWNEWYDAIASIGKADSVSESCIDDYRQDAHNENRDEFRTTDERAC